MKFLQALNYYKNEKAFFRAFADHLALTFLLGFFPGLLLVVAILSLFLDQNVILSQGLGTFGLLLPDTVAQYVTGILVDITSSGAVGLVSLGAVAFLYSFSRMFGDLTFVMNYVYQVTEARSLWRRMLLSVLFLFFLVVASAVLFVFLFVSDQLLLWLTEVLPQGNWLWDLLGWRGLVALCATFFGVWFLYVFLPAHGDKSLARHLPGSIFFTIVFILFGWLFNLYIVTFASYNTTYGVLGAIVLLLVYLKLTAMFFILGAVVNHVYAAK